MSSIRLDNIVLDNPRNGIVSGIRIRPQQFPRTIARENMINRKLQELIPKYQEIKQCKLDSDNMTVTGDNEFDKCTNAINKATKLVSCNVLIGEYNNELDNIVSYAQQDWDQRDAERKKEENKWNSFTSEYASYKNWNINDEISSGCVSRPGPGTCTSNVNFDCKNLATQKGKKYPDYVESRRDGCGFEFSDGCTGGTSNSYSRGQTVYCVRSDSAKQQFKKDWEDVKPLGLPDTRTQFDDERFKHLDEYKSFPSINCCRNTVNFSNTNYLEARDILQQCQVDNDVKKAEFDTTKAAVVASAEDNKPSTNTGTTNSGNTNNSSTGTSGRTPQNKPNTNSNNNSNNNSNENSDQESDKIFGINKYAIFGGFGSIILMCCFCLLIIIFLLLTSEQKKNNYSNFNNY